MGDAPWKKGERKTAALFGARRQAGSGSQSDPGRSTSDSTHPRLYIEEKYRAVHSARTLHDAERGKAKREGKPLVLTLRSKGKPGALVCFHSGDLLEVLARTVGNLDEAGRARFDDLLRSEDSLKRNA